MQAALRDASLTMGQAFLPVIQAVLPALQYLAAFIKIVANSLSSLFGGKSRGSAVDTEQMKLKTGLGGLGAGVAQGEEGWKNTVTQLSRHLVRQGRVLKSCRLPSWALTSSMSWPTKVKALLVV